MDHGSENLLFKMISLSSQGQSYRNNKGSGNIKFGIRSSLRSPLGIRNLHSSLPCSRKQKLAFSASQSPQGLSA